MVAIKEKKNIYKENLINNVNQGKGTDDNTNLIDNVIKDIHDPLTGKVNALLFSDFLGISYEEMATFLNRTVPGLKKNPTSAKIRPNLNRLYVLVQKLLDLFGGSTSYLRMWLNTPNPYLDDQIPLSYLKEDKLELLENMVDAMETGKLL